MGKEEITLYEQFLLFPQQISDSSKQRESAEDNLEFDEHDIMFSKSVENTMEKEEITLYKQFLLFPQHFQKTCSADMIKPGLVWERVNSFTWNLAWPKSIRLIKD